MDPVLIVHPCHLPVGLWKMARGKFGNSRGFPRFAVGSCSTEVEICLRAYDFHMTSGRVEYHLASYLRVCIEALGLADQGATRGRYVSPLIYVPHLATCISGTGRRSIDSGSSSLRAEEGGCTRQQLPDLSTSAFREAPSALSYPVDSMRALRVGVATAGTGYHMIINPLSPTECVRALSLLSLSGNVMITNINNITPSGYLLYLLILPYVSVNWISTFLLVSRLS